MGCGWWAWGQGTRAHRRRLQGLGPSRPQHRQLCETWLPVGLEAMRAVFRQLPGRGPTGRLPPLQVSCAQAMHLVCELCGGCLGWGVWGDNGGPGQDGLAVGTWWALAGRPRKFGENRKLAGWFGGADVRPSLGLWRLGARTLVCMFFERGALSLHQRERRGVASRRGVCVGQRSAWRFVFFVSGVLFFLVLV